MPASGSHPDVTMLVVRKLKPKERKRGKGLFPAQDRKTSPAKALLSFTVFFPRG